MNPKPEIPAARCESGSRCPVCGLSNDCRLANGCAYKGPCWCEGVALAPAMLRHLREISPTAACLCRSCLTGLALREHSDEPIDVVVAHVRAESAARAGENAEQVYLNETGHMVFTAVFHQRRGHCCGNGCRHCPYPTTLPSRP
jgi:hypothetical protein